MQTDRQRRRRGQATAELVIGAVGIIVVFFGLIQIAQLGRNSIANLFQARGEAERRSASDLASSPERDYVNDWKDGADALCFTADDTVVAGVDTLVVQTQELDQPPTLGDMLAGYTLSGYDSFTGYLEVDSIAYAADLRKGSATSIESKMKSVGLLTETRFDVRYSCNGRFFSSFCLSGFLLSVN
jgi:hypothetical protein